MTGFVPVPGARARIQAVGAGFGVELPARRNVFAIIFLPIWLCAWALGTVDAIRELLSPPHPQGPTPFLALWPTLFLALWLTLWLAGGGFAIVSWLWSLAGRERLRLSRDDVLLRREVAGIGFGRRYDPSQVRNLRAVEMFAGGFGGLTRNPFTLAGTLAFDYGSKTVRFGAGIDHAEASQLVERINATATWLTSKN